MKVGKWVPTALECEDKKGNGSCAWRTLQIYFMYISRKYNHYRRKKQQIRKPLAETSSTAVSEICWIASSNSLGVLFVLPLLWTPPCPPHPTPRQASHGPITSWGAIFPSRALEIWEHWVMPQGFLYKHSYGIDHPSSWSRSCSTKTRVHLGANWRIICYQRFPREHSPRQE